MSYTGPSGRGVYRESQAPQRVRDDGPRARAKCSTSEVLPMPASPETSARRPSPAAASRETASSASSNSCRSSSGIALEKCTAYGGEAVEGRTTDRLTPRPPTVQYSNTRVLPDNLGYLFDTALALTPSTPAIFQGETVLTYAELDARSNRLANALTALGVTAGDRVALLFNNDFRFLETLFGVMRLGAVAVPLNIRMGDEALRYVAEDSESAVMVTAAALAERGRMLASQIPAIKHLIADGPPAAGALAYETVLADAGPTLARRATAFDEVCMQPYTSGSTGKPKGVLLTH